MRNVFRLLEQEKAEDEVHADQNSGDLPHPAPTQVFNRVAHDDRPHEGTNGLHEEEDAVHQRMVMHEEQVTNRDDGDSFTQSATHSSDQGGCDDFTRRFHVSGPEGYSELDKGACEIERAAPKAVDKRNEKYAANSQACIVRCARLVEYIVGDS